MMYGYTTNENTSHVYDYSSEYISHFSSFSSPTPLIIPSSEIGYNQVRNHRSASDYNTSTECSSYGSSSSVTSYGMNDHHMIPRNISSHSLVNNMEGFCPLVSSPPNFLDSEGSSIRKVFSTGDLQSESPLSNESNSIIEGMTKGCKYSPEEKKERIERYKNKRNQRNFSKKIMYECRKTLADSRPRIRGRFVRNDEILEKTSQIEFNGAEVEEDEDDENWIRFLDAFSANIFP
ncbi:uncharacterized protein LOC107814818 isoform X3 [Nicotiana tabacum]|uniref:Uncharacterized protein LOC107814818 isoform X3 n=1 Tax=Nicotiana tabacum TaxID=4097 RepID=A0AC58TIB0_TOBAC